MTKEEIEAAETAKAEAEAKAEADADALLDNETEEEKEAREAEEARSQIDYEAVLKVEEERIASQQAIAEAEYKLRETEHDKKKIEEDEKNKPLTRGEMQELLLKERQSAQKEFQEQRAFEIAKGLTASDAEAKAAVLFWKTRVNATGNLEEDVAFAVGGLNYKKLMGQNSELARALRGRETALNDVAGTFRDAPEGVAPKMDAVTVASYKRAGFAYDGKDRLWKKKLPNGKFLIKDPRTKQTTIS